VNDGSIRSDRGTPCGSGIPSIRFLGGRPRGSAKPNISNQCAGLVNHEARAPEGRAGAPEGRAVWHSDSDRPAPTPVDLLFPRRERREDVGENPSSAWHAPCSSLASMRRAEQSRWNDALNPEHRDGETWVGFEGCALATADRMRSVRGPRPQSGDGSRQHGPTTSAVGTTT
jgi:hypothetical protein